MNDLSAHPSFNPQLAEPPILNTLGDLTNRENRAFYPRFSNDYLNNLHRRRSPDGLPDDLNGDNVPDLYPDALSARRSTRPALAEPSRILDRTPVRRRSDTWPSLTSSRGLFQPDPSGLPLHLPRMPTRPRPDRRHGSASTNPPYGYYYTMRRPTNSPAPPPYSVEPCAAGSGRQPRIRRHQRRARPGGASRPGGRRCRPNWTDPICESNLNVGSRAAWPHAQPGGRPVNTSNELLRCRR